MNHHGALFDLDGVLIDSESVYDAFWQNIESIYPTGIENFASYIKGNTLAKIMNYYPDPDVRADIEKRLAQQERDMRYILFDGVIDLLEQLRAADIPCAIVTSSNDRKMKEVFRQNPGFKDYFSALVTDSMVKNSKPNPEGYLLAAKLLNRQPEDCFVFEDSLAGLEAGRRSGARVIGLATTNPFDKVSPCADLTVNAIKELSLDLLLAD